MNEEVYLLLGSNQGEREEYLRAARRGLRRILGKALRVSGIYRTAAWGMAGQPYFLNQALAFHLEEGRETWLLDQINKLESELGRVRKEKWGARVIDIDIIMAGNRIINTKKLTVPHPRMHLRRFVLEPLHEIAPELRHPVLKQTISELLNNCPDSLEVIRIPGEV